MRRSELGTRTDTHLFFDVTDPADMQRIAEVQVDARTVNDVKVSEDARIAVISREGASNRRNGFVVLDVSNPRAPEVLSRFDDQMTGGVHNVFLYERHVFAINNGRRWDVINVEDPENPFRVSRFESDEPGRSVHDVWVRDGVAFQAGNSDGIILIDVGGGGKRGLASQSGGDGPTSRSSRGGTTRYGRSAARRPGSSTSSRATSLIRRTLSIQVRSSRGRSVQASRAMGWIHVLDFDDAERAQGGRPLPSARSRARTTYGSTGRKEIHIRRLLQWRTARRRRLGRASWRSVPARPRDREVLLRRQPGLRA